MPLPKSKVWLYFDRHIDGGKCKLCQSIIAGKEGNTTNLGVHLRRKHRIEITPHPSVADLFKKETPKSASTVAPPDNGSAAEAESVPDLPKAPELCQSSSEEVKVTETDAQNAPKPKPPISNIFDRARMGKLDAAKQHRITRKIAGFLFKDMRPYSTVESKYFRDIIHACDERVVVPNRDTFSERIIPAWYNIEVTKLMEELNATCHVSLTSDCWTSRTTIPYMTITAHFVDDQFNLQSKVLQTKVLNEKHTGENISVALNAALESWQISEKVSVITTDNASNMGRAISISDIDLQIGCYAHTLDLAAKKAVELAKPLSRRMKPVITFLHRSHIGAKVLKEKQLALNVPCHQLINDVETRWNSTYLMFERYFEQRVAIHATFLDRRLESHKGIYTDFKDQDVAKAEEFLLTMKDFYDITVAVCTEKNPTASLILPLTGKVLRKCEIREGETDFSKQLKRAISENLKKRYQDEAVRKYLLKCTALDPRTKTRVIVPETTWNELTDEVVDLMERAEMIQEQARVTVKVEDEDVCVKMEEAEEVEEKPSTSLLDSLLYDDDSDDVLITEAYTRSKKEMAEEEIKHYREMPKHKSPLLFFKENQVKLPNLSKLSKKYLVAQATSVTAERVFSTSGDILSSERSCLEADSLDCMIFLKKTADINSTFLV